MVSASFIDTVFVSPRKNWSIRRLTVSRSSRSSSVAPSRSTSHVSYARTHRARREGPSLQPGELELVNLLQQFARATRHATHPST